MTSSSYNLIPAAGACSSPASTAYLPSSIPGDPLSLDHKRRIYDFVQSYLLKHAEAGVSRSEKQSLVPVGFEFTLQCGLDDLNPPQLKAIQVAVDGYHASKGDGKTFEAFRKVLKDSSLLARNLGFVDPAKGGPLAAQCFMKQVIKNINSPTGFEEIFCEYLKVMGLEWEGMRAPSRQDIAPLSLVAKEIETYSPTSITEDPLSVDEKRGIYAFVQSYLESDVDTVVETGEGKRVVKALIVESTEKDRKVIDASYRAIAKTYDTYYPEGLSKTKAAIDAYHASKGDGKTFDKFRAVLKDPSLGARDLGIDPSRGDQAFAAQMFMKVVLKNASNHFDLERLFSLYACKMAQVRLKEGRDPIVEPISAKNLLLMQNDPVEKQDPSKPATALSTVLSHLYFQDQQHVAQETIGTTVFKGQVYGPSRQEVREAIKSMVTRLWEFRETRHVIEALAAVMTREKGNIIFWGDEKRVNQLFKPYMKITEGGIYPFFAKKHTVIMSGNFWDSVQVFRQRGTFIHESLHFLFGRIVRQSCSPAKWGSPEERLFDEALAKDRALRESIKTQRDTFTPGENSVWTTIVDQLELEEGYFRHGFSPDEPRDCETMRAESIVRIMEQVAEGVSLEAIRKIAPNLCEFYFTSCKPMLERYTRGEPV